MNFNAQHTTCQNTKGDKDGFLDYREKLGIGFCDNEKYKFFLVKIFSILGEIALDTRFCGINASEYREFCRITGTEVDYKLLSEFIGPAGYRHWLSILRRVCEDPREFLRITFHL